VSAPSLTTAVVAALVLVGGFAFAGPADAVGETFLVGGNVIFASMLFGWLIGDLFRPSWVR